MKHKVFIGTSGWMYKDWGKEFYPPELKKGHLSYLAQEFKTVEVNTSFYHLPTLKTFKKWKSETPEDFIFSVKLSRYITHQKKLVQTRGPLDKFLKRAKGLGDKLSVILVQLPPFLKFNEEIFKKFILDLSAVRKRNNLKVRFAFEPRHKSWMENGEKIRNILSKENIALVFPHSSRIPSFQAEEKNIIASFVYIRFHGPSEFAASRYGSELLLPWAKKIRRWRKNIDIYVYFNNDINGHAVHDARDLISLISK